MSFFFFSWGKVNFVFLLHKPVRGKLSVNSVIVLIHLLLDFCELFILLLSSFVFIVSVMSLQDMAGNKSPLIHVFNKVKAVFFLLLFFQVKFRERTCSFPQSFMNSTPTGFQLIPLISGRKRSHL